MSATVKQVDEIHIFANDDGYIIIEQQNKIYDELSVIFFDTIHVESIIEAIKQAKDHILNAEKIGGV